LSICIPDLIEVIPELFELNLGLSVSHWMWTRIVKRKGGLSVLGTGVPCTVCWELQADAVMSVCTRSDHVRAWTDERGRMSMDGRMSVDG
jgi:hypothetical protein